MKENASRESSSKNQIKSKKRVSSYGEVFTSEREVNNMLDLVKQETERIDSRFLEPACGSGNFLIEVLKRKLQVVKKYKRNQLDYKRYAFIAVSSIYGIDILQDNVNDCREQLYKVFDMNYQALYKKNCQGDFRDTIKYVLSKNILWGDALTLKLISSNEPIIFAEWSLATGSMIKRRDFIFKELIPDKKNIQQTLFNNLKSDTNEEVFIPNPTKEYPLTHFLKVKDYE